MHNRTGYCFPLNSKAKKYRPVKGLFTMACEVVGSGNVKIISKNLKMLPCQIKTPFQVI